MFGPKIWATGARMTAAASNPEFEFLWTLCLTGQPAEVARAPDWPALLELAKRHRIQGLAAGAVASSPHLAPPSAVLARLGDLKRAQAMTYLCQLAETLRLSHLLLTRGMPAIVLKGCAVAETFYQPEPAMREAIDIDLLVDPSHFDAAGAVLQQEGYRCISPEFEAPPQARSMLKYLLNAYEYVHPETGIKIELHHRLLNNPGLLAIPFDQLLAHATIIETPGGGMRGLTGTVQVAFLIAHAAEHACFRLKWLADAARAVASIRPADRQSLLEDCRKWGCERHVLAVAALIGDQNLFDQGSQIERRDAERAANFCRHALMANEAVKTHGLRDVAGDLRKLGFLLRLQRNATSRRFPLIRQLTHVDDVRVLRLGTRWLPLYCLLGRPLAAGRLLNRAFGRDGSR